MSPTPSPPPESAPLALQAFAERVVAACAVGFAVVVGPERCLVWSNRAFDEQAAKLDFEAAELAGAILVGQHPGSVVPLSSGAGSAPEPAWLLTYEPGPVRRASMMTLDSVTGVLSRAALDATLHGWFNQRSTQPFSLIFIDLVDFKLVNDRLGHVAGDECLAEVGRRLSHAVRTGDIVGRYGGDEFVLLLRGIPTADAPGSIRRRVEAEVGAPLSLRGETLQLSLSLGAAASDQGATPTELVALADAAMYDDKRRNRREMPAQDRGDVAERARLG